MDQLFASDKSLPESMQHILFSLRDNSRAHIVLATVNDPTLRNKAMKEIRVQLRDRYAFYEFDYARATQLSLPRFCRTLRNTLPACVFAYGLEELKKQDREKYDTALHFLNAHREDIVYTKSTVVLWLVSHTHADLLRQAPDFVDWRSADVTFALSDEVEHLLHQALRFEEMLMRPNLDPALVAELRKRLAHFHNRLEQIRLARPNQDFVYDVFLNYAQGDLTWCETVAERLRDEGVRVWFDRWEFQSDNLADSNNPNHWQAWLVEGLQKSRKMVAVWSPSYFRDDKVWTLAESFIHAYGDDLLIQERPLIPLLLEDCTIPPTLQNVLSIDFRNPDDRELRFRQLIEALDLPGRDFVDEEKFKLSEQEKFGLFRRGRPDKGKCFEDEIAKIYELLGFEVKQDIQFKGVEINLLIEQKVGGLCMQAIVICKNRRVTVNERDQILAQYNLDQKKLPTCRWIVVSSEDFTVEARTTLEEAGITCMTYAQLLHELVPLEEYVEGLISEYEKETQEKWHGRDWFIRPNLLTDITYEERPALTHIARWLGNPRANQLIILGDLGTGKTTLVRFLAYYLAKNFHQDPLRHPAPVLIPLGEVRKEVSLEGIIITHFSRHGLPGISFPRFEYLVRLGKVILLFDAFDEMADRVRWEVIESNFLELSRVAQTNGKVILTCRTHYFKDYNGQVRLIGEGPCFSEIETPLYKQSRQQSGTEVVYLQEFNDSQIQAYLRNACPETFTEDWQKIQNIYHLKDLVHRPLLLDRIVKSLPDLEVGKPINTTDFYTTYTDSWFKREAGKDQERKE